MSAQIEIDGEMFFISPAAWKLFEDFWGDKAYRQAGFVESFQALVLREAAEKIRAKAHDLYGAPDVAGTGWREAEFYGLADAADLIDPDKED